MKTKILANSHHRNGVCGAPFDVYLFRDEDKTVKVAIDFGKDQFAVLQVDKLSDGDISFGSNSWRGDHYCDQIRKLSKAVPISKTKDSFFVHYGVTA